MYQDIIMESADNGGRFYIEAPSSLWDRNNESQPMMVDNDFERETNQPFLDNAFGDILIGGLGIGLVIYAVMNDPAVTSITIIEKHQEVIDLIMTQASFNEKVTIIQGDYHLYTPEQQYNTIWLDDWTTQDEDTQYREDEVFIGDSREQWKTKMLPYLKEGGYINYWKAQ